MPKPKVPSTSLELTEAEALADSCGVARIAPQAQ